MNAKFMAKEWFCECQRYFVETGQINSKGNPVKIPVTIRKMHLHGDMIFTDYYRVTLVKRKGEVRYVVKKNWKPERPYWDKAPLPIKMVKDGSYDRVKFIQFLSGLVDNPEQACIELETCPPDNLEAAA